MDTIDSKNILLVEDEALLAVSQKALLEKHGYRVMTAASGQAAIELARNIASLNLILMDINLGRGMDGTEAAIEILKERKVPIIFLSSHTEPEIVAKTEAISSYGYVVKNAGFTVLDTSIKMAFRLFDANIKLQHEKQNLDTTLNSIGDAVITTDTEGRITRMNPVAESLTGWPLQEAKGRPIYEVFVIQNAHTRQTVENPITKVLETGAIVGLANHTVLVSRNGAEYQIADSGAPIKNSDSRISGVVLVFRDVSKEYRVQEALRASEEQFHSLWENMTEGAALHRVSYLANGQADDYVIMETNPAFETQLGLSRQNVIGKTSREAYGVSNPPYLDIYAAVAATSKPTVFETYFAAMDKHFSISVYCPSKGLFATIFVDISARKKADEKTRNLLSEKELLLKEVHHRVKNNLATISSLLSLQAYAAKDAVTVDALQDAGSRVQSMMVLYNRMYQTESFNYMPICDYLPSLVEAIMAGFPQRSAVTIEQDFDTSVVDMKKMQSIGIITNELLTNIMKYAFRDRPTGVISLAAHTIGDKVHVVVQDNGVGLPDSVNAGTTTGFGLMLVGRLIEQMAGTLRIERQNGTSFVMEFPL